MEKQFGENPEVTLGITYNWSKWGLPFSISVWTYDYHDSNRHSDSSSAKHFNINIDFFCIRFYIEIWKWKKNLYDSVTRTLKDLPDQPFEKDDIY